jgi:hypothetical protein
MRGMALTSFMDSTQQERVIGCLGSYLRQRPWSKTKTNIAYVFNYGCSQKGPLPVSNEAGRAVRSASGQAFAASPGSGSKRTKGWRRYPKQILNLSPNRALPRNATLTPSFPNRRKRDVRDF